MATDHLEADELRALSVGDLFDVVARHGLHFDQSRQAGIVFHMISSITEHGRVGMTAVGDTPEQAMELYERARRVLFDEAPAAAELAELPRVSPRRLDVAQPRPVNSGRRFCWKAANPSR